MYKEKLLEFMREKNKIVKKYTGLLIARKPDMEELQTWSEADCRMVLDNLCIGVDDGSCPWCLIRIPCSCCGYAKRNGECGTALGYNRYDHILSRLQEKLAIDSPLISDIPEIYNLVKWYRADVRDMQIGNI